MNATLHHPITRQPNLGRILVVSLVAHFVVLIGLSLTLSQSVRVSPAAPMQVKLVGVPQPSAATKPPVQEEKIRTQDSAAPKEPPPEMKNIPPSEAKTKMVTEELPPIKEKENPIEAQKRPPVLDKNPDKKKVVKNDLDAKVVKNPEDFMKALEFVDKLEKTNATPTPAAKATADPAGEGPQLQMDASDNGAVDALRRHIESNWLIPPGLDTRGLSVAVQVSVDPQGNITNLQISRSSGQPFFDNSLLRAVRKSVPLPIPADKYDKFRDLELVFQSPQ